MAEFMKMQKCLMLDLGVIIIDRKKKSKIAKPALFKTVSQEARKLYNRNLALHLIHAELVKRFQEKQVATCKAVKGFEYINDWT